MAKPVSKHTANQPASYMEPVAMNQSKFYMPKSILRPEGFSVEELATKQVVAAKTKAPKKEK